MSDKIPSTPADVLDISAALRAQIEQGVASAEASGQWLHPYKEGATSFEEMTPVDILYWVYKCTHPIVNPEEGERVDTLLMRDGSIIGLPEGFNKSAMLTMGAGGDLLRARGIDGSQDRLFENVADLLFDQDVAYANFESPVTEQALQEEVISDRGPPIECCSQRQFDILASHKGRYFDVLNTANNHMFDMGVEGIETTLKMFSDRGILDTGTNRSPGMAGQGSILDVNGIRLGFVSVTFGLNGHVPPEGEAWRVNTAKLLSKAAPPGLEGVKAQIDHCKSAGCDFVIASLHWGFEFEFFPRRKQVDIARGLVEYGADAIIAHHPHVIQPVEYYRTQRDPDRVAVIAHSLGSLTWGYSAPHLALSAILNLTLAKGTGKNGARTYIESAHVTPVFRSVVEREGALVTQLEKLADHSGGRGGPHDPAHIARMQAYASLVLG